MPKPDPELLRQLADTAARHAAGVRAPSDIDALVALGRITKSEAQQLKRLNAKGLLRGLRVSDTISKALPRAAARDAAAAYTQATEEQMAKLLARDAVDDGIPNITSFADDADDLDRVVGRLTARDAAAESSALVSEAEGVTSALAKGGKWASRIGKVGRFAGGALTAIAVADLIYQLASAGQDDNVDRRVSDTLKQAEGGQFEQEYGYESRVNSYLNQRETQDRRYGALGEAKRANDEAELYQMLNGRREALGAIAYQEPPSLAEIMMRAGVKL